MEINNLATKIIPIKIRKVKIARMLSELSEHALEEAKIAQQNFQASQSTIKSEDLPKWINF